MCKQDSKEENIQSKVLMRNTHSSSSLLMQSQSLIWLCLMPCWASHLWNAEKSPSEYCISSVCSRQMGHRSSQILQQVLIPELPQLHQVGPQAVDLLVHLHVSQSFTPQLLLQLLLAAVDLLHPRLQLIWTALDPRRRQEDHRSDELEISWGWLGLVLLGCVLVALSAVV